MSERNRSEGWKHAKLSGHENERLVAELTSDNEDIRQRLLSCAHLVNTEITKIEYGG